MANDNLNKILSGVSSVAPMLGPVGIAVGAAASIGQMISGASRANKAKKALEDYQRQELKNVTAGMRVSTLGAELQTQEAQRRFASTVDALRAGGTRGLAGIGAAEAQQQQVQQQIGADLDRQQQQIEQLRAQDDARIRSMQEAREGQDIAGMGAELQAARAQQAAGASNLLQSGLAMYKMSQPGDKTLTEQQTQDEIAKRTKAQQEGSAGGVNMPNIVGQDASQSQFFKMPDYTNLGFGNIPNTFTKTFGKI